MRILVVLTSQATLGEGGPRAGFSFDELATAYLIFSRAGAEIALASPQGGAAPIDPSSYDIANPAQPIKDFLARPEAYDVIRDTLELREIDPSDFDAAFYPGGSGLMLDLPADNDSLRVINSLHRAARPMAFLSQAPAALCRARDGSGVPIVAGQNLTIISRSERPHDSWPPPDFGYPDDLLRSVGANIVRAADQVPHVISDDLLVTGQNSASAFQTAAALLAAIEWRARHSGLNF